MRQATDSQRLVGTIRLWKTVLLQNVILDIYRDCFSRIFVFSPSVEVDVTWKPVKQYIEKHMKVSHTAEEPIYFDHYVPDALANILETQHKITSFSRSVATRSCFKSSSSSMTSGMTLYSLASLNCFTLSTREEDTT